MVKHILVVIDPLETLNAKKDTSLYLMHHAMMLGHSVSITTPQACYLNAAVPYAKCQSMQNAYNKQAGPETQCALSQFDLIIMRKDPPVDLHYIYCTQLLSIAQAQGVPVINNPHALRDCNEKLFINYFPSCIPETMVTYDVSLLLAFWHQHQKIVLKTLDGMGGSGVYLLSKQDHKSVTDMRQELIKHVAKHGMMMAQRFLPEVYQGDKRILLINGKPLPFAVLRLPKDNDFRANLAQGGSHQVVPLTQQDQDVCAHIAPQLQARGLFFVGLDVIGSWITEINITSPTCLQELDAQSNANGVTAFWNAWFS